MNNNKIPYYSKIGKNGIFLIKIILLSLITLILWYHIFHIEESRPVPTGPLEKITFLPVNNSQSIARIEVAQVQKKKVSKRRSPGLPFRIKIPKIQVDAVFEYVGITPGGAMDVPKNPSHVAWFHLGPRPGEEGSAVVAGHFGNWKSGAKSVFDNLHLLRKGDTIEIEDNTGNVVSFIVKEVKQYDSSGDTEGVFSSSSSGSHLNLITCDGVWDKNTQSYSKRLVVFAKKSENK